ncbi:MAG: 2-amino-4-hydroxy-6-hydroxymethyldihydropteridine diphosphokinase, partial [Planctomycetes bacterium]|nr:2-amino-4-hydroxy-6-hydroxymethyldihydropteridine diphosphokinase [Planctomycetota bacterium]
MPERAFISIGSNIEPEKHIVLGIRQLSELGRLMGVSKVYENTALGPPGQPDFLNGAALIETDLLPDALRKNLTEIEDKLGRDRSTGKFAPRT